MARPSSRRRLQTARLILCGILLIFGLPGCRKTADVQVESQPAGANIYVDEEYVGQTPARVRVEGGRLRIDFDDVLTATPPEGRRVTSRTLKAAYLPLTANLPLFVALDKGFFQKNGIDVEAIEATSPNDILTGIVSGNIDFAAVLAYSILLPGANRYPGAFKLFSSSEETDSHFTSSLIVTADSPIDSYEDLRGKRIGVYTGLVQINFLKAILVGMGISPDEVRIMEISPRLQVHGLVSGEYDVLSSTEPTVNIAVLQGRARVLVENPRVKYITHPFPSTAATIPTALLENEPEVATAIITSLNMAIDYINAHPDDAKRSLANYTPIPKDIEQEVLADLKLFKYCKLGEENRLSVQRFADFLYEHGIMNERIEDVNVLFGDVE